MDRMRQGIEAWDISLSLAELQETLGEESVVLKAKQTGN